MMNEAKEYAIVEGLSQEYSNYTAQDQATWRTLFHRQTEQLEGKASQLYLECLAKLEDVLHGEAIPEYSQLDAALKTATGWSIFVVPGLISVQDFFKLLSQRQFSASTWIRKPESLDYIEEPDMFHDVFGHIPMLMDPAYADFMQRFGEIGVNLGDDKEAILGLQRLYWFTIEFGLMKEKGASKIYGAGIISSFGEVNHSLQCAPKAHEFDLGRIFQHKFRNDEIQNEYYILDGFSELTNSFNAWCSVKMTD